MVTCKQARPLHVAITQFEFIIANVVLRNCHADTKTEPEFATPYQDVISADQDGMVRTVINTVSAA